VSVTLGNGNSYVRTGAGDDVITLGSGSNQVFGGGGNKTVPLHDAAGTSSYVQLGDGNNTVTVGNGNDTIQLGNGDNVIVEGSGNDYVNAGNGANFVVAGTGQHTVKLGNGNDILIDGDASLTRAGRLLPPDPRRLDSERRDRGVVAAEGDLHHVTPEPPVRRHGPGLVLLRQPKCDLEQEGNGSTQLNGSSMPLKEVAGSCRRRLTCGLVSNFGSLLHGHRVSSCVIPSALQYDTLRAIHRLALRSLVGRSVRSR
jgi:Ca2+-binding RTX toxin-like protein